MSKPLLSRKETEGGVVSQFVNVGDKMQKIQRSCWGFGGCMLKMEQVEMGGGEGGGRGKEEEEKVEDEEQQEEAQSGRSRRSGSWVEEVP